MDQRNFKVYKNALVKVTKKMFNDDDLRLVLTVENEKPFVFPAHSNENSLLFKMDERSILEKFNGGTYVFLNGELLDYRDSFYTGFVRDEYSMQQISDVIGCSTVSHDPNSPAFFSSFRKNTISNKVFLGGEGDTFNLSIGELNEGGEFKNRLINRWNPFSQNVNVSLETIRLVCSNGMVGMSEFVSNDVPMLNRFQEHLNLVSVQLKPQLNNILKERFINMSKSNISLYNLSRSFELIQSRFLASQDENQRNAMSKILTMLNPSQLSDVYVDSTLKNKNKMMNVSGHFTQYDVYNMLTEVSSHTQGMDDNNIAIQKHASSIVFDELKNRRNVLKRAPVVSDSDHRRAFFSDINKKF